MKRTDHYLYKTYDNMKNRCSNSNNPVYQHYGGRGIKVCDRWLSDFWNFVEDMGDRPEGMSLERINNDVNYTPENCTWADKTTQANNTRKVRLARGTYKNGKGWNARITIGSRQIHLGSFKSEEEAHQKYAEVRDKKLEAL